MLIFFRCYCHILIKIKVHWFPLYESLSWSFCSSKNAPPSKNILSSSPPPPPPPSPPPSCKHKFLFTLVIFSSTSSSNNETNGGKGPTLERGFEFTNGIHVKKHTNQLWLEVKMNMVIIDLTMMITCMPIFSNYFWISILSQKFPPWHKFHFVKTVHAILKGAISLTKWPWSKLSYLANQSANKNNMDLPFYNPNYHWYHAITIEHICFKCNILDCMIQMIYYD